LLNHVSDAPEARSRFEREAQTIAGETERTSGFPTLELLHAFDIDDDSSALVTEHLYNDAVRIWRELCR
jgi:heme-degrading monooxygenase HmoA